MEKLPTLKQIPAFAQFSASPGSSTAKILAKAVDEIARPYNGQATSLLNETIQALGSLNQYHEARFILAKSQFSHAHDGNEQTNAVKLMLRTVRQAQMEGYTGGVAKYGLEACRLAREMADGAKTQEEKKLHLRLAYEAAGMIASVPGLRGFFKEMSVLARENGDKKRADEYWLWSSNE